MIACKCPHTQRAASRAGDSDLRNSHFEAGMEGKRLWCFSPRVVSVRNIVLVVLDHIIGLTPIAEEAILDYLYDEVRCFSFCHVGAESVFQEFDGLPPKTGQPRV